MAQSAALLREARRDASRPYRREDRLLEPTFYGFKNGNGHLFAHRVQGDFSAVAEFAADYRNLYDQAGLMIYIDDRTWLKAGTEFTDGAPHFSVVTTREDQSDWSMMPLSVGAPGQ